MSKQLNDKKRRNAVAFFKKNAGYSYDPKTETPEQGRNRCALSLARAERWADKTEVEFHWRTDDISNRDFTEDGPEYFLWVCVANNRSGEVIGSLGGVDFGENGQPDGKGYSRVIAAEIALEAMP